MLSYRYKPQPIRIYGSVDWERVRKVLNFRSKIQSFNNTSSIILPTFTWLYEDEEVVEIINKTFNIYEYHVCFFYFL